MGNRHEITPNQGGHISEQLSAYMDGALGTAEGEAARLHLEGCALCRAEFDEMLATRDLLRSVPMLAPPRAFTLTEEMIAPQRREGFWERLLAPRNVPRLATGSVLSFALVVMLLVGNLLVMGRGANTVSRIGSAINTDSYGTAAGERSSPAGLGYDQLAPASIEDAQRQPDAAKPAAIPTPMANLPMMSMTALAEATSGMQAPSEATATTAMVQGSVDTRTDSTAKSVPSPPNTGGADAPVAQATSTQVTASLNALATTTALTQLHFEWSQAQATAQAEAMGRAAPGAPNPEARMSREFDDTSGDGGSVYFGLLIFFLGLGLVLGAGALVARRRT